MASAVDNALTKYSLAQEGLRNNGLGDAIERKHRDRILAGAARFVAANKSDPFAGRRVAAHLKNGIGIKFNKEGDPESYDAEKSLENRSILRTDGSREDYKVEIYLNVARP